MIAPTSIHPPKNWQDFETLCLKLWGEIWNIPHEIEFNSDNSQGQQGVDIYGPVEGGLKYNGIQCKNKKLNLIDGSPNRITIPDVQAEIDKAINFEPPLSKLVIATSLPKDQKVEEYVRKKSVEHVKSGLFTIQICFWEFFERKIPEFQSIHDWYFKNENYLRLSGIRLEFEGGETTLEVNPKFKKTITKYSRHSLSKVMNDAVEKTAIFRNPFQAAMDRYVDWEQYCWFNLSVVNTGKRVIEDYKIELDFEGEFLKAGTEKPDVFNFKDFKSNVKAYSNTERALLILPYDSVLVPSDGFLTKGIFLKPNIGIETTIELKWKLLSRDFEDSGTLNIKVKPQYLIERDVEYVEEDQDEGETIEIGLLKRLAPFNPWDDFRDDISDWKFE